jgi:hypothetical protein
VAKAYLKNTFLGSMEALNAQHTWRSRFEDQLNINYKDWLLRKVQDEFSKGAKVEDFVGGQTGIIGSQVQALEETKEPIKKSIAAIIAKKHRIREIESDNKRTVQFLFDPKVKVKIAPFTRKYLRFIEGNLTQFENDEREKFENYIQAIEGESIEGGNDEYNILKYNPIVFENMPLVHFELTNLNTVAFQLADDPFFKSTRARFYPEVVVMNMSGKVKAKVNH